MIPKDILDIWLWHIPKSFLKKIELSSHDCWDVHLTFGCGTDPYATEQMMSTPLTLAIGSDGQHESSPPSAMNY